MASDRGTGLMAGYQAACQDGRWVCDQFHEFQELFIAAISLSAKPMRPLPRSTKRQISSTTPKVSRIYKNVWSNMSEPITLVSKRWRGTIALSMLLQWLRETLHLCSPWGRLRTVEGVRSDLPHLLDMIKKSMMRSL